MRPIKSWQALAAGLLVLLLVLLVSCGPAYRGEPIMGPLVISEPEVVLGQRVFYEHCHQCHPGGAAGIGPALNNLPAPAWLLRAVVRHGVVVMPPFSEAQISDAELDALVRYLLRLREHSGEQTKP